MVLLMRMLLPNLEFGKIPLVAACISEIPEAVFWFFSLAFFGQSTFLLKLSCSPTPVVQMLFASSSEIPASFGKCLELV